MQWARGLVAGVATIAALAAACNALNGVGDLQPVDAVDTGAPDTATAATCTCTAAAPAGWTGPVAVAVATGENATCPAGTAAVFEGHAELTAPAACTPCACTPAPDAGCGELALTIHTNGSCGGQCSALFASATCGKTKYCTPNLAATLDAEAPPPVDGSACVPSGGAPVPPTWARGAAACAPDRADRGACPAGEVCGVGNGPACVFQAGDVPCPPGPYQTRNVYYANVKDGRTCAPCSCDPPTGVKCAGGVVTLYGDPGCATAVATVAIGEACKPFVVSQASGSVMVTTPGTATGGTCAAHGGDAGPGTAAPDQPTTMCCAQ